MENDVSKFKKIEDEILRYGRPRGSKTKVMLGPFPRPIIEKKMGYVVALDYQCDYGKQDIYFTAEGAIANAIRNSIHRGTKIARNIYDEPLHHKVVRVEIIALEEVYNTKNSPNLKVEEPKYNFRRK